MSKRAASYDIDEHTYEEKERVRDNNAEAADDEKHLAGRKIFRIRKNDQPAPQPSGKVQLKLMAPLDNNQKNDSKDTLKDIPVPENPFKFNLFNQSQGIGLFSNILTTQPAPPKAELITDNASKETANHAPKPPSISSSLFAGNSAQTKASIFSNPGASLFSSGSGSLFSNQNKSSFLFGNTTGSTFGSSLFGNKITGPITAPPEKEEEEGDSAELEKDQQMVVDPTKSTVKYDYGAHNEVLRRINVAKYKKDKGSLVENVEAIIKLDVQKKIHYLVIMLPATKNVIFTGIILPNQGSVKRNQENIDLIVFEVVNKSVEPHRIKMQIKGQDKALKQFYQLIFQIINEDIK